MTIYYYNIYGLNIHSQIKLPELLSGSSNIPDVTINYGQVPLAIPDSFSRRGLWDAVPGKFLLRIDNIARYLVSNGNKITVEKINGCKDEDIRTFLLGSTLGALLYQRNFLPLHASAIKTERGAVVFTGHSGSGKSTLLTALTQRGYAMMNDDISGISLDEHNRPWVSPAFPRTRLWADAAAKLDYTNLEGQQQRGETNKYSLPISHICQEKIPLCAIYLLTSHNQNTIQIEPVTNMDRIGWLWEFSYRKNFVRALALQNNHLQTLTAVAGSVKIKRITRPIHKFMLDELIELIEHDLKAAT